MTDFDLDELLEDAPTYKKPAPITKKTVPNLKKTTTVAAKIDFEDELDDNDNIRPYHRAATRSATHAKPP